MLFNKFEVCDPICWKPRLPNMMVDESQYFCNVTININKSPKPITYVFCIRSYVVTFFFDVQTTPGKLCCNAICILCTVNSGRQGSQKHTQAWRVCVFSVGKLRTPLPHAHKHTHTPSHTHTQHSYVGRIGVNRNREVDISYTMVNTYKCMLWSI